MALAEGIEPNEETARSILMYARNHLSAYQRIRRIEFFDLPKTISGKIRRVELRQREDRISRGEVVPLEWRDDQVRDAPLEGESQEAGSSTPSVPGSRS